MTKEQAAALGYEVIAASHFEVGLVRNGHGICTWWARDFDGILPDLGHPKILETIEAHQQFLPDYMK